MLNVRANSAQELDELLGTTVELVVPNLGAVCEDMAALANIQATFPGTTTVGQGGGNTSAPAVTSRTCPHGQMQYKEGNLGTPNEWRGYFCALPRDAQGKCKAQYVGK